MEIDILKDVKFTDLLGTTPDPKEGDDPDTGTEPGSDTQNPADPKNPKPADPPTPNPGDPKPGEGGESGTEGEGGEGGEGGESGEGDEEPAVVTIAKQIGYEFAEGEEYEDTIEGMAKFIPKVADKLASEQLLDFFGQYPKVEEFARYCINGGDPEKYFETIAGQTVEKITLTEEDEASQKVVVSKFLAKQGLEEAEIAEMITDYANTGLLFKQAKIAQAKLAKLSESEKARILADQQRAKEKELEDQKKLWTNIETTVTSGTLKGIQIPETEKKKFFDWMAKPIDKKGRSQRDLVREKLDVETIVALEYLLYKNFDLGNLVKAKAKTIEARTLRERLAGSTAGSKLGGSGNPAPRKPGQLPGLDEIF